MRFFMKFRIEYGGGLTHGWLDFEDGVGEIICSHCGIGIHYLKYIFVDYSQFMGSLITMVHFLCQYGGRLSLSL